VTTPSHGTATYTADYIYYTPDLNYVGSDQFGYTITDNNGGSDSATVYVTVGGTNDPPTANDDTATVLEDSSGNMIDVLVNDVDIDGDNLTIVSVTTPGSGSASTDGNYTYYTPNPNYNGADSFTYTISDGNGGTDTAIVSVNVTAQNDPPTANDDTATVDEDSSNNQINALANDNDIDGDSLTIASVTTPSNGSASTDGSFVYYTPDPDYNGADSFTYNISDGNFGTDTATVYVTVTAQNDPPTANDDYPAVSEDSIDNQLDVLANDIDIDGDQLDVSNVTTPLNGIATFTAANVYYTPDPDYNGLDQFVYTVTDNNGGTDTATVYITVSAVNDPPTANDDIATVLEDSSNNQINVLVNDNDIDGDNIDITGVSTPSYGTATFTVDYVYYTPDLNFNGADQFGYNISDGNGGTDTATVYVTVTSGNDPPTANDDNATVIEDSVDNQIDVLANDIDLDGDDLDIIGVLTPTHGTATFTVDYVYYTPDPDYTGSDQFGYTISDGNGGSDSATVYVTVTPGNDPPTANDDTATVLEDSSNNLIDVLANDIDLDGDNLTVVSVTTPSSGSTSTDGSFVYYSPNPDYNGLDSFTYNISDGNGGTDTATVTVTITPQNDDPVANNDSATVNEDSTSNQINVLGNDIDIDGDSLAILSVTTPTYGSASILSGFVYYTPDPNYNGPDQFNYTITDGNGGVDSATVFITVDAVNDPPTANDDSATVVEDSSNNQIDVLINDNDIDGDNLDVIGVSTPSHGTANYTVDYVYYTPDPDYSGSDQFSYTITDNNGGSDSATVYVTVSGINDPPTANDDTATVLEDSSNNLIDVLANDIDIDGDSLTIVSVTTPSNGSASTDGSNVYYTPNPDYNGVDSFTYTIFDGNGGSDTANVSVTVTPQNDPPQAVDDYVAVPEDSIDNQLDVLANDIDIDGDSLDVTSVTTPSHGTATYTADYIYYTPDLNYVGYR
jgi:hypothetical protein